MDVVNLGRTFIPSDHHIAITMPSPKIVLCTGANQGLGLAIIQVAALRDPASTFILCSRNLNSGKEALQKLKDAGVTAKVDLVQLEVTDDVQIAAAAKQQPLPARLPPSLIWIHYPP